jgi:endoribonuclease Dicer
MALVLPVVMYRIDSVLVAFEACSIVGLTIRADLALEAMTKDSFNTEEHGEDQIDFQPGMGKNYERLEFLGDTFLKMATTISVYTLYPGGDEFDYHVTRMVMLCNNNLFKHAVEKNLPGYIRTKAFDRRTWYPSNITLKRGKAARTEAKHCLSHKSIADVCEALIGAAYMTSTSSGDMDMAVKAVTAMVSSEDHIMGEFSDYFAKYKAPKWHSQQATAAQRHAVDKVAEITGYRFQCAPLLRSVFRHPSYVFENNIRDYQRLEFLGDALIDMAVVDFLFKRFPEADPKWLTEHKMAMVSNQFLGCLCVKLGLHKHILLATSALLGDIREYAAQLEQAEEMARRKSQAGGVGTASDKGPPAEAQSVTKDFWIEVQQPPKALADVVEALVGAMFVDSGYSFSVVLSFFTKFMQPFFEDMALYSSFASNHPVTAITQKLQDFCCSQWKLHVASVPPPIEAGVVMLAESELLCALMIHGKVIAHATSTKSGSSAKVTVAKIALEKLAPIQDVDHFRTEMGCDCGGGGLAAVSN